MISLSLNSVFTVRGVYPVVSRAHPNPPIQADSANTQNVIRTYCYNSLVCVHGIINDQNRLNPYPGTSYQFGCECGLAVLSVIYQCGHYHNIGNNLIFWVVFIIALVFLSLMFLKEVEQ